MNMEHHHLMFVPTSYQPPHVGCAVHVFDAETGHHLTHLTVDIPTLSGAVDMRVAALAVAPGGAAVFPLVWFKFPQVSCIPYLIDMEQHPPSARIIGAGTIDSGGSVEAAVGIAAAPDTGRVYATISNNGGFGFSLDWVGFLGTEIPVGKGSQGVAASPDGTRLYVANSVDGTVSVLDTTGRTSSTTLVGTVPVGQGPLGIAVAPDSGHAYIANATDGTVSVIDANTLVANTFPVAVNPQGVAIAPSGKHVYVAHGAPTNALHVIDPANPGTGQISISTLDGTCAVSVTPDNRFVWVLCAPTGSATPACLLQIATEGPHKNEVVKKIDLSALGFVRVPEFVGVFVTPPINRQEIGVVARVEVNSPVVRGNSTTGRVHIEHALSRPTYVWLGVDPTTPASSVVVQERAAIPAGAKHADFDIGVALTQNPGEILIDAVAVFVKRAALKMEQ
jgi:YVTN family beta-propeller protein